MSYDGSLQLHHLNSNCDSMSLNRFYLVTFVQGELYYLTWCLSVGIYICLLLKTLRFSKS